VLTIGSHNRAKWYATFLIDTSTFDREQQVHTRCNRGAQLVISHRMRNVRAGSAPHALRQTNWNELTMFWTVDKYWV